MSLDKRRSLQMKEYRGAYVMCDVFPRRPLATDIFNRSTGRYYPLGYHWIVGKDPQDGVEGEIWILEKIVANQSYWRLFIGNLVDAFIVDVATSPGVNPVSGDAAGDVRVTGGQTSAGTIPTAIRTHSYNLFEYTIEVQRTSVSAVSDVSLNGVSHFNSAHFSVDADGFVSLAGMGLAIDSIGVDFASAPGTNPVLPDGTGQVNFTGSQVSSGTTPNVIRIASLAANQVSVQIQRSTTSATSNLDVNGVSHYSSAQFSVDANGFVTLAGGTTAAVLGIDVQSNTAPGTDPVIPGVTGLIAINGAVVAAQSIPVRSHSIAANALQIEVQRASATATTDTTSQGLASFSTDHFSADSNGFITLSSGGLGVTSITGTENQVLANATFATPQTGAVTLTLSATLVLPGTLQFGGNVNGDGYSISAVENYTGTTGLPSTLRTNTDLSDTLSLQAYDVDGAAYVSFITLTADNSPSCLISNNSTWNGNTITVPYGGTGATTLTTHGVLLGQGTAAVVATAAGITGEFLGGNTGADPTWKTLSSEAVTSITGTANQIEVNNTVGTPQVGAVTLDFTDGISLGSYQATTPPTGGIIMPGKLGVGTNSVATEALTQFVANSDSAVFFYFQNLDNTTSTAHSYMYCNVGGDSAGDPKLSFVVFGSTSLNLGIDNSDSDKFKISFNPGGSLELSTFFATTPTLLTSIGSGTTALSTLDVFGNLAVGTFAGTVAAPSNSLIVSGTASFGSATMPSTTGNAARLYASGGGVWIDGGDVYALRTDVGTTGHGGYWLAYTGLNSNLNVSSDDGTPRSVAFSTSSDDYPSGTLRNGVIITPIRAAIQIGTSSWSREVTGNILDNDTYTLGTTPFYTVTDGGSYTISRQNYIYLNQPVLTETSGDITITDGTVFSFNAAAGTHVCVDAGTTKTTPTDVDGGWVKVNINGSIRYIPCYTSKTA